MIIEIVVLGLLVLIEGYVIWKLTRKTELLETWIENFGDKVSQVQDDLTAIDSTGHFESDDEIGSIFDSIKEIINDLNNFQYFASELENSVSKIKKSEIEFKNNVWFVNEEKNNLNKIEFDRSFRNIKIDNLRLSYLKEEIELTGIIRDSSSYKNFNLSFLLDLLNLSSLLH